MAEVRFLRLGVDDPRDPTFDSGDAHLNAFFFEHSRISTRELLSVSYAWNLGDKTVAFFSVSNDAVPIDKVTRRNWFWRKFPNGKRLTIMPAIKIGRFAVASDCRRAGHGTQVMDFIKLWFITGNKTGCRFIILDALNNPAAITFYESNGFRFLNVADAGEPTRLMYFDLMEIARHSGAMR